MITLENDRLLFRFPAVHEDAVCPIHFQRTLRLPDDGKAYPLPAGVGGFPLRHIEDFSEVTEGLRRRGGVVMPMWQAEAMWIRFGFGDYPFAVKVAAGKINAVSGEPWRDGLHRDPQDYVVVPDQPWLDGFSVARGTIRQFVAAPLGKGLTAEEQLTGSGEFGGVQIVVHPMKREAYERLIEKRAARSRSVTVGSEMPMPCAAAAPMGLAAGGLMKQEIFEDRRDFDIWDLRVSARCFVTLLNAESWSSVTGEPIPTEPISASAYRASGIPWFDYYASDQNTLRGAPRLAGLKTIIDAAKFGLHGKAWKNEETVVTPPVLLESDGARIRRSKEVRQGDF